MLRWVSREGSGGETTIEACFVDLVICCTLCLEHCRCRQPHFAAACTQVYQLQRLLSQNIQQNALVTSRLVGSLSLSRWYRDHRRRLGKDDVLRWRIWSNNTTWLAFSIEQQLLYEPHLLGFGLRVGYYYATATGTRASIIETTLRHRDGPSSQPLSTYASKPLPR